MLPEEANWVARRLGELDVGPALTCVDVGSSTDEFRRVRQGYIDYSIFRPLRAEGVRIIYADAKLASGVDAVMDVARPDAVPSHMAAVADIVLCCNLLEHVVERATAIRHLAFLAKPGGHLIVSVPFHFPYHADPIDTLYRPNPTELVADLKPWFVSARAETVECSPPPLVLPDGPNARLAGTMARTLFYRMRHGLRMPRACAVTCAVLLRT